MKHTTMKDLQKHEAIDVGESEVKLGKVARFTLGLSGLAFAGGCGDEDTPNRDSETSDTETLTAFLDTEGNDQRDDPASQSIVDELTRLLDKFEVPDKSVQAALELDAFFSDVEKTLAFVLQMRQHPAILRRLFSAFKKSPEFSDSGCSVLVRVASHCLFPEASSFLDSCKSAQNQNLRSKATLAKAIFAYNQCEAAWFVQNNQIPMDSEFLSEIDWCFSDDVVEFLSQLDISVQRRDASILATRVIAESGDEPYTDLESVAEYGRKKLAFYSSVGADTQLTDLIEKAAMLQLVPSFASSKGLTIVVIQYDHFDREPEEVSFIRTMGALTDLPDLQLVWVSTRQMVELQNSLPNKTIPASLTYIYDEDGETWRSIGSNYVCLTCVYDHNGVLRFRGQGYASAESIRKAVTIVGEVR